jgi:hypothetical protein
LASVDDDVQPRFSRGGAIWGRFSMEIRMRLAAAVIALGALCSACTPTVKVKLEVPTINIYAKLDADVRVRLDKEVQTLIQQNPDLF